MRLIPTIPSVDTPSEIYVSRWHLWHIHTTTCNINVKLSRRLSLYLQVLCTKVYFTMRTVIANKFWKFSSNALPMEVDKFNIYLDCEYSFCIIWILNRKSYTVLVLIMSTIGFCNLVKVLERSEFWIFEFGRVSDGTHFLDKVTVWIKSTVSLAMAFHWVVFRFGVVSTLIGPSLSKLWSRPCEFRF